MIRPRPVGSSLFSSLAALLLLAAAPARAEERAVIVPVVADFEPQGAVGLLFSPSGTRQVEASVNPSPNGPHQVEFRIDTEKLEPGTAAAGAFVVGADGKRAFSNIVSLSVPAAAPLPACEVGGAIRSDNISIYEKLMKLRGERRRLSQQSVGKLLTQELSEKLSTLERGFGLETQPALAPDINPLALVDRLSRLREALREYVAGRGVKR